MKKVADGLPSLRTGCPRHPDGPVVMRCMRQDSTPPGPIAQSGQSNGLLSRLPWVQIPLGPYQGDGNLINIDRDAGNLTSEELEKATDDQLSVATAQLYIIDLLRIDPVNMDVMNMVSTEGPRALQQYISDATYDQFPVHLIEVVFALMTNVFALPREKKIETILEGNEMLRKIASERAAPRFDLSQN